MPQYQGALDGLCGAYSIVNALSVLRGDPPDEAQGTFNKIIQHLSEKGRLSDAIRNGIGVGHLIQAVNAATEHHPVEIEFYRPYPGDKRVYLPTLWDDLQKFMNNSANGVAVAIIGLAGVHRHWTVVKRITRNRMYFDDSDGLQHINRAGITVGRTNIRRQHRIVTNEVIYLNNPNVNHL